MLPFFTRYLVYRRLKPVVTVLPHRLAGAFGGGKHYTVLQVKRAISDLKLHDGVELHALAAACSLADLQDAIAGFSAEHYERLRAELAHLFNLRADFTMEHICKTDTSGRKEATPGHP